MRTVGPSRPRAPRARVRRALTHLVAAPRAAASRWLATTTYGRKWLVLGSLIGLVAGLGAVVFYEALVGVTHLLLGTLGQYRPPTPAGEGGLAGSGSFARPWAIPLIVAGGALLASLLVVYVAPEAEGHGTDAAIAAVHHNPRGIRLRAVAVKIVASALTIGAGGSGGREGPTGQISAGFGSALARLFDLGPRDARIAVSAGIGSGIGAIFGAPLGGAVLASEVLYRDDFEVDSLLPAFIASIVAYALFGSILGFTPLFGYVGTYHLLSAGPLAWFAVIGVVSGLVGLAYATVFYRLADAFARSRVPRWLRPALGGLVVGLVGLAVPQVLGTGYGWVQHAFDQRLLAMPLWLVLVIPLARIVATGLSIGSGGSGGIFGPGMVIGAFVGAAVWRVFAPLTPGLGHDPAPFAIVGMMACFGSIARAPLAVMLMVAEMTGTLSLLIPAMVAVGIATLIVSRTDATIYRSQLRNRAEAPAHRIVTGLPLLATVRAEAAVSPPRLVLDGATPVAAAAALVDELGVAGAPVVDDDGRLRGVVRVTDLAGASATPERPVADVADGDALPLRGSDHLDRVVEALLATPDAWAPVVDDARHVVGVIGLADVVRAYRSSLRERLAALAPTTDVDGVRALTIAPGSALDGAPVRSTVVHGVLLTTIQRGDAIIEPRGTTVLAAGDRITALGSAGALERVARAASTPGPAS